MLQFTANVVNSMNIAQDGVRVALITYSNEAILEFNLTTFMNSKADMIRKILSIQFQEGYVHSDGWMTFSYSI